MTHFIFHDESVHSYWLIECDSYASQDHIVHCDNSNIASFRAFNTLALHEHLKLTSNRMYKIIEQYRPFPDLTQDTWLLAV